MALLTYYLYCQAHRAPYDEGQEPYDLKSVMLASTSLPDTQQLAFCSVGWLWRDHYSWTCQPVDYTDSTSRQHWMSPGGIPLRSSFDSSTRFHRRPEEVLPPLHPPWSTMADSPSLSGSGPNLSAVATPCGFLNYTSVHVADLITPGSLRA